jgi:Na+/phosphate symporter
MNAVVQFWVSVLSLLVSVAAVGYLFVSFLFPATALVFQTRTARLAVLFVALVGIGTLVWSAVVADRATDPSAAPKNRNR